MTDKEFIHAVYEVLLRHDIKDLPKLDAQLSLLEVLTNYLTVSQLTDDELPPEERLSNGVTYSIEYNEETIKDAAMDESLYNFLLKQCNLQDKLDILVILTKILTTPEQLEFLLKNAKLSVSEIEKLQKFFILK